MSNRTVLTGITTTGTPHLGNYVGAIKPSIQASRQPGMDSYFFLADYHALIKCHEPEQVRQSTLEIAATWLALGLDTDAVTFYRQSDIPEISELTWLPGSLDDVPAVMRAFDVFVLPSQAEGISNTILEAMAACREVCDPKFSDFAIYEHCLPFNVARAFDEARDIDTPRIWTAERDRQMWDALQG